MLLLRCWRLLISGRELRAGLRYWHGGQLHRGCDEWHGLVLLGGHHWLHMGLLGGLALLRSLLLLNGLHAQGREILRGAVLHGMGVAEGFD